MIVYADYLYTASSLATARQAIQLWLEDGAPRTQFISFEKRKRRYDAAEKLRASLGIGGIETGDVIEAWRGTNRKEEYQEVKSGVDIVSTNHITGEKESGVSVSVGLSTVWAYGYDWAYKVSGPVVSFGSDGEPVLANVEVVSPLLPADQAIKEDWEKGESARQDKVLEELVSTTGATKEQLLYLMHNVTSL